MVRGWTRRLTTLAAALILTVGAMAPVSAQTSDTVQVTGTITTIPLRISITLETVPFGEIDSDASPQTGAGALGYPASFGAFWIAVTPIAVEISSPGSWGAIICAGATGNLPARGLRHFSGLPLTQQAAEAAFLSSNPASTTILPCGQGAVTPFIVGSRGISSFSRYLGTHLLPTDSTGAFNATVVFSVTLI